MLFIELHISIPITKIDITIIKQPQEAIEYIFLSINPLKTPYPDNRYAGKNNIIINIFPPEVGVIAGRLYTDRFNLDSWYSLT